MVKGSDNKMRSCYNHFYRFLTTVFTLLAFTSNFLFLSSQNSRSNKDQKLLLQVELSCLVIKFMISCFLA